MKIGILGIGYAGQLHSKAIEKLNTGVEYYVYDVMKDAAQEFAKNHNCQAVENLEELFNKVDAVIIATPTFTHYNFAMQAMKKGKHILCEKPMALLAKESEEMLDLSKKQNLICSIGFNYRFFDITELLKKDKLIGKIVHINLVIKRLFRENWHNENNGVMADLGIHLIDYITYLSENKIDLSKCNVNRKCMDKWDYDSNITGETENGISFELTASRINEYKEVQFRIEIVGQDGILKYDSRQENVYFIEKDNIEYKNVLNIRENEGGFFDFSDSIFKQDKFWIRAINGKNENKIATFQDGVYAQEVLEYFLKFK